MTDQLSAETPSETLADEHRDDADFPTKLLGFIGRTP